MGLTLNLESLSRSMMRNLIDSCSMVFQTFNLPIFEILYLVLDRCICCVSLRKTIQEHPNCILFLKE